MKSEIEIKVRGYHVDIYSHVNNARYLEFLEEGRWAAFENMGNIKEILAKGYGLTVVNINISYISAATAGDILLIKTGIDKIGTKSIVISQKIFKKEGMAPVINALVTFVLIDMKSGKSVPVNEQVLKYLNVESSK